MKETVFQTVKIVLFSILFLFFLIFFILATVPERTAVEVRREFTVFSSSLSGTDANYMVEVTGTLRNKTSKPVMIDSVSVRVAGRNEPLATDEPVLLQPRTDTEIILRTSSAVASSDVLSVSVSIGGEMTALRNPAVTDTFGYAFFPLILALLFLLLLIHAVTVRVYMAQEKKVPEEQKK